MADVSIYERYSLMTIPTLKEKDRKQENDIKMKEFVKLHCLVQISCKSGHKEKVIEDWKFRNAKLGTSKAVRLWCHSLIDIDFFQLCKTKETNFIK